MPSAIFYQPFLYERLAKSTTSGRLEIVRISYYLVGGLLLALIAMTILTPLFFRFFVDQSYAGATAYVFWIGLSYVLWGVYILFAGFLFYAKKTGFLGGLAVVNVILNILLNYFLILEFGALGAAYATCISFFVVAVIVAWKAMQLYPMPWFRFARVFSNG